LGCGPGRNALYLASAGFTVDAVDLSPAAIAWAKDRARETDAEVQFHLLDQSLAPDGHLALTCFAAGDMGSELPDADIYRHSRLDGGLAYTPESLRWIFSHLTEVELRRMRDQPPESPRFGEPFLWTALFRHDAHL
jgi:SAM-dependent methyltransferase